MDWYFLLSWDSENDALLYTDSLPQKKIADPSIGTPIILNLYLNETIKSVGICYATILPQKLNFQPYSASWNTILLVLNCNIK